MGFEAVAGTPEELTALVKSAIPLWKKVIDSAGVKAE